MTRCRQCTLTVIGNVGCNRLGNGLGDRVIDSILLLLSVRGNVGWRSNVIQAVDLVGIKWRLVDQCVDFQLQL